MIELTLTTVEARKLLRALVNPSTGDLVIASIYDRVRSDLDEADSIPKNPWRKVISHDHQRGIYWYEGIGVRSFLPNAAVPRLGRRARQKTPLQGMRPEGSSGSQRSRTMILAAALTVPLAVWLAIELIGSCIGSRRARLNTNL